MPGRKPLATPGDIAYCYDGSLKGFYSCVHESVYSHTLPLSIATTDTMQPTLLPLQQIHTSAEKARRVREAIRTKIDPRALELIETVFLSCLPDKELPMLRVLLRCFAQGRQVLRMLDDVDMATLLKAEHHLLYEAHLLKGFIRFSDYEGNLIATIKPKNFALPFLVEHFTARFSQENFLIYDRTHRAALMYVDGQSDIIPMEEAPVFEPSEEELAYRALWKQFYHTIGIEARENPRCRRSHMPKRYWSEMTEMQELL